jgi:hypothetical protein
MNLPTKGAICSILVLIVLSSFSDSAVSQTKAQDIVDFYMRSLIAGDIENIQQCLGKDLQKRRENTFKDPTYSNFLLDRYDGATYRIVQNIARPNGSNIVDVEITFKTIEKLMIRLLLDSRNKIIDEIIL